MGLVVRECGCEWRRQGDKGAFKVVWYMLWCVITPYLNSVWLHSKAHTVCHMCFEACKDITDTCLHPDSQELPAYLSVTKPHCCEVVSSLFDRSSHKSLLDHFSISSPRGTTAQANCTLSRVYSKEMKIMSTFREVFCKCFTSHFLCCFHF